MGYIKKTHITNVVQTYLASNPSSSGKSAYEVAVDNGFLGTEGEWLLSLKGDKGNDGEIGENGRDGYTPIKGIDYFDGAKGDKGDTGDQGLQGLPGSDATVTKSAVEAVLTGEIASHTHAGGSGSARISVELFRDGVAITDTNCPSTLRFFKNLPYLAIQRVDLSSFTQVRFNVMKAGTAGAAASKLILRYIVNFSATAANYLDIGVTEVGVATNVQNTSLTTGWINLVAGAKADVHIALLSQGGDGALDPIYGNISCEFK